MNRRTFATGAGLLWLAGCVTSGAFEEYQAKMQQARQADRAELLAAIADINSNMRQGPWLRDRAFHENVLEDAHAINRETRELTERLARDNRTYLETELTAAKQDIAGALQNLEQTRMTFETRFSQLDQTQREALAGFRRNYDSLVTAQRDALNALNLHIDERLGRIQTDLNTRADQNRAEITRVTSQLDTTRRNLQIALHDLYDGIEQMRTIIGDAQRGTGIYADRRIAAEERARLTTAIERIECVERILSGELADTRAYSEFMSAAQNLDRALADTLRTSTTDESRLEATRRALETLRRTYDEARK